MSNKPNTVLETERLVLKHLTMDDLDELASLYRDPEVRRYFPEKTLTYEATKDELEWIIDVYYGQYGFGLWATIHKESGAFIGRCGLIPWTLDGSPEVEVAYLIAKEYWGQGLGTEVARAIARYGFDQLHLPRLICLIDPDNAASKGVAGKVGMRFEKEVEDKFGRALLYAASRPCETG